MSWEFVYCPACGTDQEKIGGCQELMFCSQCSTEWMEPQNPRPSEKASKTKKKGKRKRAKE